MKRRTLLTSLAVGSVALSGCSALGNSVDQDELVRRSMAENQERAAETAAALQRTDRITTVLSGTASPLANEGAQTCTAVFVNGQFLLFDVGDGAMASIRASLLPQDELDAVFVTHHHNDHYADLGEAMQWSWIQGRRHVLPVHGPTGITRIVESFEAAYELEATYRTAHHGAELMPPEWVDSEPVEFAQPEGDSAPVVYDRDGVVVKAFRANHEPVDPAVGYRIEFEDEVVVISGDTLRTTALLTHSRNADLLVAEAMNKDVVGAMERAAEEMGDTVNATLLFDVQDYHMDIREVGALATEANVQRLALNHLAPKPQGDQEARRIFEDPVKESYSGELFVGEDGMQITVPVE